MEEYLERKNYNKDINQMCPLCIKDQIKKIWAKVTIKCEGLLSGEKENTSELRHHFSEEEVELVEQAINPYKWAEKIDTKMTTHQQSYSHIDGIKIYFAL